MEKYLLSKRTNNNNEINCAQCKQSITSSSFFKCGTCKSNFHPICVKALSSDPSKVADWLCPSCRATESKNSLSSGTNDLTKSPSVTYSSKRPQKRPALGSPVSGASLDDSPSDVATELRLLRYDITEIKTCLQLLTEGMAQFNSRLDTFDARIQAIEEKNPIVTSLQEEVTKLKDQLSQRTQDFIGNEFEILGIKETPNENLEHMVMTVANKIGIDLPFTEIDWVTRVGAKKPKTKSSETQWSRPIIVRLTRRNRRDEVLRAAKARSKTLTTDGLNLQGPSCNIYLNEHLTKENRLLFRNARLRSRDSGYKYCWVRRGKVYLRKKEGFPPIPINSYADLEQALPSTLQSDIPQESSLAGQPTGK